MILEAVMRLRVSRDRTFCVYFVLLVNSDVHCFRFVVCTESYAGNKS